MGKAFIIWCIQGIMDDKIILMDLTKLVLKEHFPLLCLPRLEDSMLEISNYILNTRIRKVETEKL